MSRIKCGAVYSFFPLKIYQVIIGLIVTNKIRPTKKPRAFGLIKFIITFGAPNRIFVRIGSNFPPIQIACFTINRYPPRISMAHSEYFRTCVFHSYWKKIPFWNGITTVIFGVNFYDFPPQIVRIGRPPLIIFVFMPGSLI